jgi:hypothetical protein
MMAASELILFSEPWMKTFGECWIHDSEINRLLFNQEFTATIAYGFIDNPHPRGAVFINNSCLQDARLYQGEPLDWDLRARPDTWKRWLSEGFRLERMGYILANKELIFEQGDYRKMLHVPRLASAFFRSFELMQKIPTQVPQSLYYAA